MLDKAKALEIVPRDTDYNTAACLIVEGSLEHCPRELAPEAFVSGSLDQAHDEFALTKPWLEHGNTNHGRRRALANCQ
jgi:hypothetical protein